MKVGSLIKIGIKGERFFVKVNMINDGLVYATIRNNLVAYNDKKIDYTFGDNIVFRPVGEGKYTKILKHTSYKIFPR